MKCLQCSKEMILKNKSVTNNGDEKNMKYYQRKTYHCENNDIWVTVETPQEGPSLSE